MLSAMVFLVWTINRAQANLVRAKDKELAARAKQVSCEQQVDRDRFKVLSV
jgi:hypothetical protein